VFENRVLTGIFGPKKDEVTEEWRKLHSGELHNFTHPQMSLGRSYQGECGGWSMCHAWDRRENCRRFRMGEPREKIPFKSQMRRWEDRIKMDLSRLAGGCGVEWSGFTWLRVWTVGGLL
jgi:hypothetical protein